MRAFVLRPARRRPAPDPILEALHRAFGPDEDDPTEDLPVIPPAPPRGDGEREICRHARRLMFVDMAPREARGNAEGDAQYAEMAAQEREFEMAELLARQAEILGSRGRRATLTAGITGVALGVGVALLTRHLSASHPWTLTD